MSKNVAVEAYKAHITMCDYQLVMRKPLTQDEVNAYVQSIIRQEDGTFMCPRCHVFPDQYKHNVKRHLQKKKPCTEHNENQHTTTHITNSTTNHDNSVHTSNITNNNINITDNVTTVVELQPWNRMDHAWEEVFNKHFLPAAFLGQSLGRFAVQEWQLSNREWECVATKLPACFLTCCY